MIYDIWYMIYDYILWRIATSKAKKWVARRLGENFCILWTNLYASSKPSLKILEYEMLNIRIWDVEY
jgi:hypothetical protein